MTGPMVSVTVDVAEAIGFINSLSAQVPYAMSIALNRCYDEAQARVRGHIKQHFVLRQERYVLRTIRRDRGDMARKDRLYATVRLAEQSSRHPNAGLLKGFIEGESKVSHDPLKPVAIPTEVIRPSFRQQVPRFLYPSSLGLTKTRYTVPGQRKRRRSKSWKRVRPFVLDPTQQRGLPPSAWGVYMRTGPKREDVEMIWSYKRRVARPKRLPFEPMVRETVQARWVPNMRGAFEVALASARTPYFR